MAVVDGGTPYDSFEVFVDGGEPLGSWADLLDGGSADWALNGGGPLNLPDGVATTDVFGTLLATDGSPCIGSVVWTATVAVAYPASDVTLLPKPIEAFLDDTGYFFLTLPVGDDPAGNPMGWSYAVAEKMAGGRNRMIKLSGVAALQDYAELVVEPSTLVPTEPVATYFQITIIDGGTP